MIINAKKIIDSVTLSVEDQMYFANAFGKPVTSFVHTIGNLVTLDPVKIDAHLSKFAKGRKVSIVQIIKEQYGEEFLEFFINLNIIGYIKE